ncbi:MAG: acyltransferase [Anaerolineales bacterium]|nr:acyltransferase [Anaerolineales bacterium]
MADKIVSPPAGETKRFEALEAYRGVAALMIVVYHAYQHSRIVQTYVYEATPLHLLLRSLDSGVSFYLALSGFLIFLPFAYACLGQRPYSSARGFLIRRAIRLVPLYYVAILVVWSLRYTGGSEQWLDLLEHLTFTQIFDAKHIFWTIGPAWSLAVEVLFYLSVALAAPLLQRACERMQTQRQRIMLLLGLVTTLMIASLAYKGWAFYLAHIPQENYAVYFGFLAKADLLALGMLLAIGVAAAKERFRLIGWQPALLRLVGLGLLSAVFILRESNEFITLFFHSFCGLAFTLLLASTVLEERGSSWQHTLEQPVYKFLGLISYSIYIWHEPILIELSQRQLLTFQNGAVFPISILALLAIVILAGAASYYAIEYPTQFLRYLFTRDGNLVNRYPD